MPARVLYPRPAMDLSAAIRDANNAGRLGLLVYTIPGFPSAATYRATLSWLEAQDYVSIIETTIPVTTGFSEHANETIREAHATAARESDDAMTFVRMKKPSLCVLYQSTAMATSFDDVCRRCSGIFDGMILEWSEPNETPYVKTAAAHGIELVQCIGPWMDQARMRAILDNARQGGLVYLMSAQMTGAKLFSRDELCSCIEQAKTYRPDIVMAAGFGVRTEEDVRFLATVPGLDAAIVGTEFLRKAGLGEATTRAYVESLGRALARTAS